MTKRTSEDRADADTAVDSQDSTTAGAPPSKRRRRWPLYLALTLVSLSVGLALGLTRGELPLGAPRGFDLNHVRVLSRLGGGAPPERVARLSVAREMYPLGAVVAGWDWMTKTPMVFASFQIAWRDRYWIVDAPHEAETHRSRFGGEHYDDDAAARLEEWYAGAEGILVTHEHLDHVRGLSQSANFRHLAPRIRLTQAQIENMPADTDFAPEQLDALSPVELSEPTRVAPGVVLIPAPGHTPGSIWIYVGLAGGQEVLLVGDSVWSHHNLTRERGRPALLALALGEDREGTLAQARALRTLRDEEPTLAIVPAHDDDTVRRYLDEGFLTDGFVPVVTAPATDPTAPADPPRMGAADVGAE